MIELWRVFKGCGWRDEDLDHDSWMRAAAYCDELVPVPARIPPYKLTVGTDINLRIDMQGDVPVP